VVCRGRAGSTSEKDGLKWQNAWLGPRPSDARRRRSEPSDDAFHSLYGPVGADNKAAGQAVADVALVEDRTALGLAPTMRAVVACQTRT